MWLEIILMICALISATTGIAVSFMLVFIREFKEWGFGKLSPYIVFIGGFGSILTFMYLLEVTQKERERQNPQQYELIKYEVYKKK